VSHPSLGLPPRDLTAGHPADGAAIRAAAPRLAARALERAVDVDPTFRERYGDLALRELLADTEALAENLATAVASDDPTVLGALAEQLAPRYRKRNVPLDDVIALCEGLRLGAATVSMQAARPSIDSAVDAAATALRWHRRLAGDARKRNPFIAFIYKGA
jgi:CRP-like cAMP-binding protein